MGRPLYTTVMLTLFILSLLALRGVCAADDLTENEMPSDLLEYQQKQKEELETLEMDSAGEESEVNVTYLENAKREFPACRKSSPDSTGRMIFSEKSLGAFWR